ncbi:ProQ/FINO family protein [Rhizobium rosettiformans]
MLLRPDAELKELRNALRRYAHSAQYLQALSQDDSMRHEINGEPAQAVNGGVKAGHVAEQKSATMAPA